MQAGRNASTRYLEVWAYCLMPNHVHLILNPRQADGLGRAVGEAHRRYTNFINARGRWTGHLFQSRFASVAMDESHPVWSFGGPDGVTTVLLIRGYSVCPAFLSRFSVRFSVPLFYTEDPETVEAIHGQNLIV